jgi:hypothetical protein
VLYDGSRDGVEEPVIAEEGGDTEELEEEGELDAGDEVEDEAPPCLAMAIQSRTEVQERHLSSGRVGACVSHKIGVF